LIDHRKWKKESKTYGAQTREDCKGPEEDLVDKMTSRYPAANSLH